MYNLEDKIKINSKRTARAKSTRRHQLSLENVNIGKWKDNAFKSIQEKNKGKKKKKEKNCQLNSKFVIPLAQWSKSNSLIVFSEKDSTMSHRLQREADVFRIKSPSPNKAATLIQKTWRGYLTRKLLQQYITDE